MKRLLLDLPSGELRVGDEIVNAAGKSAGFVQHLAIRVDTQLNRPGGDFTFKVFHLHATNDHITVLRDDAPSEVSNETNNHVSNVNETGVGHVE